MVCAVVLLCFACAGSWFALEATIFGFRKFLPLSEAHVNMVSSNAFDPIQRLLINRPRNRLLTLAIVMGLLGCRHLVTDRLDAEAAVHIAKDHGNLSTAMGEVRISFFALFAKCVSFTSVLCVQHLAPKQAMQQHKHLVGGRTMRQIIDDNVVVPPIIWKGATREDPFMTKDRLKHIVGCSLLDETIYRALLFARLSVVMGPSIAMAISCCAYFVTHDVEDDPIFATKYRTEDELAESVLLHALFQTLIYATTGLSLVTTLIASMDRIGASAVDFLGTRVEGLQLTETLLYQKMTDLIKRELASKPAKEFANVNFSPIIDDKLLLRSLNITKKLGNIEQLINFKHYTANSKNNSTNANSPLNINDLKNEYNSLFVDNEALNNVDVHSIVNSVITCFHDQNNNSVTMTDANKKINNSNLHIQPRNLFDLNDTVLNKEQTVAYMIAFQQQISKQIPGPDGQTFTVNFGTNAPSKSLREYWALAAPQTFHAHHMQYRPAFATTWQNKIVSKLVDEHYPQGITLKQLTDHIAFQFMMLKQHRHIKQINPMAIVAYFNKYTHAKDDELLDFVDKYYKQYLKFMQHEVHRFNVTVKSEFLKGIGGRHLEASEITELKQLFNKWVDVSNENGKYGLCALEGMTLQRMNEIVDVRGSRNPEFIQLRSDWEKYMNETFRQKVQKEFTSHRAFELVSDSNASQPSTKSK
jgi:hypothetical protein